MLRVSEKYEAGLNVKRSNSMAEDVQLFKCSSSMMLALPTSSLGFLTGLFVMRVGLVAILNHMSACLDR